MESKMRRQQLVTILTETKEPVTGTALAKILKVSRQVVVGDIAILRAAGMAIYATPQGYMLPSGAADAVGLVATIACRHSLEQLEEELFIIVDNGAQVMDVVVEHPVYGEIRANLMLKSRRDVKEFLQQLKDNDATPLSAVTKGIHLHTLSAPSKEVLEQVKKELEACHILIAD